MRIGSSDGITTMLEEKSILESSFAESEPMMEETKDTEARCSEEPHMTTSSAECLPAIGPPNSTFHNDNVGTNHHLEEVTNYNQQESFTEDPELSLKKTVSNVSLIGKDMLVDGTVDSNHQQETNLRDSHSTISSTDHNTPDVAVVPSHNMIHPVPHSVDPLKNELESISNQLHVYSSVELVDDQIIYDLSLTTSSETRNIEESLPNLANELHHPNNIGGIQKKAPESVTSAKPVKNLSLNRGIIDTAAPFESVKEAVTKFGGIVDWKAHKQTTLEKHKLVELELERMQAEIPECKRQSEATEESKSQVLKELDRTNRIVEELKLNLEKAQTEEAQAKQDSELAQLRIMEMEQGIANESSVAAKAQLEVAKARHEAAVAELRTVKAQLKASQDEYVSLVKERDIATKKAEDAKSTLKEIEKKAEELTLELISTKESLESAHAAHLEAEEHRIGAVLAREQDCLRWEKELKHAEEEVQQLNQQLLLTKNLKAKLEKASALLFNLKAELASYMESKLNQESQSTEDKLSNDNEESKRTQNCTQALTLTRKELEEVKGSIAKAKDEVNCLRVAASSLKSELARERASLTNLQQREGMASIAVSSLEAELDRTKQDIEVIRTKEKAAREKMVELPKLLQRAAQEADEAKSAAQMAREELRKSKEEAEQAKASASTIEIRLQAAIKEIEATRASEKLALAAIKALQESEQASSICGEDSPHSVNLPLDEYFNLSKRAHEAEELAHERVTAAIAQIEVAKQSESKSLERLNEAYKEMRVREAALHAATEKAEKAKEGKLGAEQELRKWRAENEQRRRANNEAKAAVNPQKSPPKSIEQPSGLQSYNKEEKNVVIHSMSDPKHFTPEDSIDNGVSEVKTRKKKKSLVPKIVLFSGLKKSQPIKYYVFFSDLYKEDAMNFQAHSSFQMVYGLWRISTLQSTANIVFSVGRSSVHEMFGVLFKL
ncbi:protein WEAK CHLOROPLAST MOVEMENT UNDER BLUE LIGHT 1 isoform X1 [Canna indica]|uniref:Protein WEAK CHLOROPLAST MOVEMENT UNDER BLUE LIGHT 1 isoform X1 n=1 Tax=Canna indica TaxID=4628 RepID=A0AAQ3KAE3_9LILI|nr:protein WEAK CHLOROPLAST MOVEMENT UNDER BLUE LIGHT 1 isoform X1 [Canna indica]